jgi:hypothetical protein
MIFLSSPLNAHHRQVMPLLSLLTHPLAIGRGHGGQRPQAMTDLHQRAPGMLRKAAPGASHLSGWMARPRQEMELDDVRVQK